MKPSNLTRAFLAQARHLLVQVYLPRIAACLRELSAEQIWWRPNPASNSVGNLVLHLEGNVRQWLVSGLGGTPDRRERDLEFAETRSHFASYSHLSSAPGSHRCRPGDG